MPNDNSFEDGLIQAIKNYHKNFNEDVSKLKALSRICIHERGFENWWKFDLGTYLWEFAKENDCRLFIEESTNDRADILICSPVGLTAAEARPSHNPTISVPIELKVCFANQRISYKDEVDKFKKNKLMKPFGIFGLMIAQYDDQQNEIQNVENLNKQEKNLGNVWFNERMDINVSSSYFPTDSIWSNVKPGARLLFWKVQSSVSNKTSSPLKGGS